MFFFNESSDFTSDKRSHSWTLPSMAGLVDCPGLLLCCMSSQPSIDRLVMATKSGSAKICSPTPWFRADTAGRVGVLAVLQGMRRGKNSW